MTKQNIDELILFVLKKHNDIMLFAIARYIRKEFKKEVNNNILLARLKYLESKNKIKSRKAYMISGYYYEIY